MTSPNEVRAGLHFPVRPRLGRPLPLLIRRDPDQLDGANVRG